MFGKKDDIMGKLIFDQQPAPVIMQKPDKPVFVEFEGATSEMEEDGRLTFSPRGKITIQLNNIGGYYDHTILLMGYKIRVMETYAQIAVKILEAMK